jgi:hypothetical protein
MAHLALLAENDNARDGDDAPCDARARAALLSPLRRAHEAPAAACRKFHTIGGERVLSSSIAVEELAGSPRWRVSVALWGRSTSERRDVMLLLAQHLALPLGQGPLEVEVGPSTVFVRRALTARERSLLVATRVTLATGEERRA